ncbi:MAG: HAD hydrolase family protein [Pseudomonadota bacterium]|nr:HAD hydrolase family protein [Pseudomonadota bacterium]
MNQLDAAELQRRAARIRCLFLDIDGVLTDCKLYLGPDGLELKAVDVKDGLGIKLAMKAGIEVAIISGRPSPAMQRRFESLGVRHLRLSTEDKLPAFDEIRTQLGLEADQCAAMGDDLPDLPLLQRCGLALTVADAHRSALSAAHWVSTRRGGNGAVREACDLLMDARGQSDAAGTVGAG